MSRRKRYVIALDQGTTTSRALLVDREGRVVDVAQRAFAQRYPHPGWVEHDPREIAATQLATLTELMVAHNLGASDIEAIGIANQRETTIVWDRKTGEPIANAIVWQCRRTAPLVEQVCGDAAVARKVTEKTGLIPDAYFSASKIAWILDHVPGARERAEAGELAFGTVDSWLLWTLTHGRVHATDPTNASRTMLYDIRAGSWDRQLCDLFGIPMTMLPDVLPSAGRFGETDALGVADGIPICGVAGDQQAALFGQCCFEAGEAKNTYGTGCFLLMHTGDEAVASSHGLVTTVAASAPGAPATEYALEGSVFMAGALLQWLRDGIGLVDDVATTSDIARSVPDTGGVYVVPAFTGLGAPYWDADARGAIVGLTRGTTRAHIVRASLEALAYQLYDLVEAMRCDSGISMRALNVDGGASANDFLMQFQSDVLRIPLRRPASVESTAVGAAYLAGLTTGFWSSCDELRSLRSADTVYEPGIEDARHDKLIEGWNAAVRRTMSEGGRSS